MTTYGHIPVLLRETVEMLGIRPAMTVVDATLGGGGHAAAILPKLDGASTYLGADRDDMALIAAERRLKGMGPGVRAKWVIKKADFRHLRESMVEAGIPAADALIADLGVSSMQIDDPGRGFSFMADGPLDMRQDRQAAISLEAWLAASSEAEIAAAIVDMGDERPVTARRIAHAIKHSYRAGQLRGTVQLASLVAESVGAQQRQKIHPATRVFQALRMAVNDEIGQLRALLESLVGILKPLGRAILITFHSVEDRMVKEGFRALSGYQRDRDIFGNPMGPEPEFQVVTRRVIVPGAEEIARNPRARSAKMRVIERKGR